jgi:hypothetical protein
VDTSHANQLRSHALKLHLLQWPLTCQLPGPVQSAARNQKQSRGQGDNFQSMSELLRGAEWVAGGFELLVGCACCGDLVRCYFEESTIRTNT